MSRTTIKRGIILILCSILQSSALSVEFSGGTGEPNDPYQIATAGDLIMLGDSPEHYGKHFILTADIDLDPNLPGRKIFEKAVIAPDTVDTSKLEFDDISFTGVFDGNGYTISNLTITGARYLGLFGRLGTGAKISNLGLEAIDVDGSGSYIGGLVGENYHCSIISSYSTGRVTGNQCVGGLVGVNWRGYVKYIGLDTWRNKSEKRDLDTAQVENCPKPVIFTLTVYIPGEVRAANQLSGSLP